MATCPHCGIVTGPGKRHQTLVNGLPCPNAGNRSGTQIPWSERPSDARGAPRFRLPLKFGKLCARVVDVGLVEPASLLLKNLLRKHGKDDQK